MSKKYLFGVKYLIPYHLTTLKPLGIFEVLGSIEIGREIEQLLLTGGHANAPWGVEAGEPTNNVTATIKEYPDFAFSILENASVVNSTAETLGYVSTLLNTKGVTVLDAVTGIDSAAIKTGEGADIPSGFIILEAITATAVKVYLAGDVASGRIPIVSELPVLAESVTIPGTGGTVDLAGYGITITGGSGAVAFTIGDIAKFDCRPANTSRDTIQVGSNADVNYFGLLLVYPRNAEKEQSIVRFPKVAAVGMSFSANTREFSEFEQAMTPLIDSAEDILYELIKTKIA